MPKTILAQTKIEINDAKLIGMIMPLGVETVPAKHLLCNGQTVSRTTYAALFAIVGTTWGTGDGSTTFHLPDMRGRFLRGKDGGAGRDPGGRTASNSGGATGDAVGSIQGQSTARNGLSNAQSGGISANHQHFSVGNNNGQGYPASASYPIAQAVGGNSELSIRYSTATASRGRTSTPTASHTHTTSMNAGDAETRGLNANVNYIIRVQ